MRKWGLRRRSYNCVLGRKKQISISWVFPITSSECSSIDPWEQLPGCDLKSRYLVQIPKKDNDTINNNLTTRMRYFGYRVGLVKMLIVNIYVYCQWFWVHGILLGLLLCFIATIGERLCYYCRVRKQRLKEILILVWLQYKAEIGVAPRLHSLYPVYILL